MSKSYKKTPICGNCADSDKKDKRIARKQLRRRMKSNIQLENIDDEDVIISTGLCANQLELQSMFGVVSDEWSFSKDGKRYVTDKVWQEKIIRK